MEMTTASVGCYQSGTWNAGWTSRSFQNYDCQPARVADHAFSQLMERDDFGNLGLGDVVDPKTDPKASRPT